jgi:hypothetical protein
MGAGFLMVTAAFVLTVTGTTVPLLYVLGAGTGMYSAHANRRHLPHIPAEPPEQGRPWERSRHD